MRRHDQALLFLEKAREDETLVDEVISSFRYPGIPAKVTLNRPKVRQMVQRVRRWVEVEIGAA